MRAYKNAALCLSDFEAVFRSRNEDPEQARRYQYFIDMAGTAWQAYRHWVSHPGWEGTRLKETAKQVRRANGMIEVADGVVFPILAALSNFVVLDADLGRWVLRVPSVFRDKDMIDAARRQLTQHQGRPVYMGRSGAAYEALMLLTEMAVRFSKPETAQVE